MASTHLSEILNFFKALSDESRLKIVGAVASCERSVDELAELLDLRAPTVSHHLGKLKEVGLVKMRQEGTTHLYQLNSNGLRSLCRQVLAVDTMEMIGEEVASDAWERRVLTNFFDGDRLKEIPASRKKREVILKRLAGKFQTDRRYSEKEVNAILSRHHWDTATLRRELVGARLLHRQSGNYWREQN
ncbi:MAG TPA: metalloregulator ArsR/SmtB family transcription factor [Candidatus Obscuribacterales bacterium]